jgi:hypothetical protein
MKRPTKNGNYETGYGKPPKAHQFQKGRSGNPKGRPKQSPNFRTILKRELAGSIEVTEGGRRRRMTKVEAMTKQVVNSALKADPKAVAIVLAHTQEAEDDSKSLSGGETFSEGERCVLEHIRVRLERAGVEIDTQPNKRGEPNDS